MEDYRLILPDDDDGSGDYEVESPDDDSPDDDLPDVESPDVEFDSYEEDDEPQPFDINEEWERNYAEQNKWDYRFSIKEMMLVTAFAAVVLTLLKLTGGSLGVMALVLGVATGLGMILMHFGSGFGTLFYLCWWMLLALYLIVSVVAMVRE